MAVIRNMTTTAFHLTDELMGQVHVYRAGEALAAAWQRATRQYRSKPGMQLPFRSLAMALRIHAGDFVVMLRWVEAGHAWIISRQPLDQDWLHGLLQAWEMSVLGDDAPGRISRYLDDLHASSVVLASLVEGRPGRPPHLAERRWIWEAARWEAAHRLASRPLAVEDRMIPLRPDSEASLLSWDNLVPGDVEARGRAMHVIETKVMTLPGIETPVLGLSSHLSRLTTRWFKPRPWIDLGQEGLLLRADVGMRKASSGWQAEWADHAVTLLQQLSLTPLPSLRDGPSTSGALRAPFSQPEGGLAVGKGVGPWFHEAVARHGRHSLENASPLVLERVGKSRFPVRDRLATPHLAGWRPLEKDEPSQLRLCVLYATDAMRYRLLQQLMALASQYLIDERSAESAHERLLALEDGDWFRLGPLEIVFLSPPEAPRQLLEPTRREALARWLDEWWPRLPDDRATPLAVMVETLSADAREDLDRAQDPKPLLRELLALRGAVSQFIAADSLPTSQRRKKGASSDKDHAGHHALIDLLRSAGCFLRAFPAHEVPPGTLLVGIYTVRISGGRNVRQGYRTHLVACVAGTTEAYGYLPAIGWEALGRATAGYMLSEPWPDREAAGVNIRRAVEQLRVRHPEADMVLYFEAVGNRGLFPCLADTGAGRPDSWMLEGQTAVVRVKSDGSELPRVAGQGSWDEGVSPATSSAFRPMVIQGEKGHGAAYLVSGSAVQERNQNARQMSRFSADTGALREDWHSLGMTEFWTMAPGSLGDDAVLAASLALCRGAPTWQRTLRWPVPLHLARAVVEDHPMRRHERQ